MMFKKIYRINQEINVGTNNIVYTAYRLCLYVHMYKTKSLIHIHVSI